MKLDHAYLACMLAGYKDLFFLDAWEERLNYLFHPLWLDSVMLSSPMVLESVLREYNIHKISWEIVGEMSDGSKKLIKLALLYTAKGRESAFLFIKNSVELPHGYIRGLLLGYQQKDIAAFFRHCDRDVKVKSSRQRKQIERYRAESQAWIQNNRPTISQWIGEHRGQYNINSSELLPSSDV